MGAALLTAAAPASTTSASPTAAAAPTAGVPSIASAAAGSSSTGIAIPTPLVDNAAFSSSMDALAQWAQLTPDGPHAPLLLEKALRAGRWATSLELVSKALASPNGGLGSCVPVKSLAALRVALCAEMGLPPHWVARTAEAGVAAYWTAGGAGL